ncbi:S-adenosylmethionine decarboxylase proenzyme, prokaryotic class 1B [hydrothermal vent metagenome]|uniref:S-adenosylmethionine decarboxylase proenzyme n=1 Tax=hydrothermal vent metagenome TaxID=652676 RepID=A0A3B1D2B1_9ZZZZ
MKALGIHILLELEDCNIKLLDDLKQIEVVMLKAAKKAKATIIDSRFHRFSPFGVSGVVVIAESHLTIHTWPEHAYAAVDIFTCGKLLQPKLATAFLVEAFASKRPSIVELDRGIFFPNPKSAQDRIADEEGDFLKQACR